MDRSAGLIDTSEGAWCCSYSLGLESLMQQAAPPAQAPVLADALNSHLFAAPWSST